MNNENIFKDEPRPVRSIMNITKEAREFSEGIKTRVNAEKFKYQEEYCFKTRQPILAMEVCPFCKGRVFDKTTYYDSQNTLITSCSLCNHTFAD